MSGLSMFRTISRGVERLAWRHGAEDDRPTDGKIKAPPSDRRKRLVGRSNFANPAHSPAGASNQHAKHFNTLTAIVKLT